MQFIKCDVLHAVSVWLQSFGSFLLAGDEGKADGAAHNAEIMIHQPAVSGGIQGPASDIRIMSEHIQRSKRRLNRILAQNCGRTEEEVEKGYRQGSFHDSPGG